MKVEVKELDKPTISIKFDGKEYKLTKKEADKLANELNKLLDKRCKLNYYPQVIYVDRYVYTSPPVYQPTYPVNPYITWCGP